MNYEVHKPDHVDHEIPAVRRAAIRFEATLEGTYSDPDEAVTAARAAEKKLGGDRVVLGIDSTGKEVERWTPQELIEIETKKREEADDAE